MIRLALLLLIAVPTGAGAQAPSPAVATSPEAASLAAEFAGLYVPEALVRDLAIREFKKNFRTSFTGNPDNARLESQYPGSLEAGMAAGVTAFGKLFDNMLPRLRSEVAAAAVQKLTVADLTTINAFYRTPLGQKTQVLVGQSVDTTALAERARTDPENFAVNRDDIAKSIDPGFIADFTADERAILTKFSTSAAGRHFEAARPSIEAAMLAEQNIRIREGLPAIQQAVQEGIVANITAIRAKTVAGAK